MDALAAIPVLVGILAILAMLGIGAGVGVTDSRPGFTQDQSHHSSFRSEI